MGINKDLGLPFGEGMQKVAFAFDVDGTLINEEQNHSTTVSLLIAVAAQKWKNVDVIVWSGGGADYAKTQYERITKFSSAIFPHVKFHSKLEHKELRKKYSHIVAVDDVQDTRLGDVNLIVRNK